MVNQYQQDLFDQFVQSLGSAPTPALKTALRVLAHFDLNATRKFVKFLKQHTEALRAGDAKAVEQYEGNKERLIEVLDAVAVRGYVIFLLRRTHASSQVLMDFTQVHGQRPIMAQCLTVCYNATDSLAPGESPDDFYRGLSTMKRTLQETVAKVRLPFLFSCVFG